jgi:glycosyltransferase involved in cell wall biosynthesis
VRRAARHDATPDAAVRALLDEEATSEPDSLAASVADGTKALRDWLSDARTRGRRVVGYGAASRAVALLCRAGVGPELLPAIADAAPAKQGRRMPGSQIPVISPQDLVAGEFDEVLLFLPDLLDEVRATLPEVERRGRWVIAEPVPTVVKPRTGPALVGSAVPPLTVGLPVHNGQRYLAETLTSLLEQEDVDFELVIADNASTDRTAEICHDLTANDPRVRYARREYNVGVTANHNRLVEQSRAPLFMWAAADDLYQPKRLRECLTALDEQPWAVLAFTAATQIDATGTMVGNWHNPCRVGHHDPIIRLTDLIGLEHENYHCYGLFRRDVLMRTQLLPPVKNNDRVLVAELALHGPFAEVDEELLAHRLHDARLTRSVSSRDWYRTQRTDCRTVVLPNIEEAYWYLRAVRRAPLGPQDRLRAMGALRPWFAANAVPMARNIVRAAIDGMGRLTGKSR